MNSFLLFRSMLKRIIRKVITRENEGLISAGKPVKISSR